MQLNFNFNLKLTLNQGSIYTQTLKKKRTIVLLPNGECRRKQIENFD